MPIQSLSDLQAFVAIVEAGSFTAAARRLRLTVNAVSRRLQQLEGSLGTKLIERTTRRSSPTEAGQRLFRKAPAIFAALVDAEADVQASRTAIDGTVRVALPPSVVTSELLAGLQNLLRAHPQLRIDLRVSRVDLPGVRGVDVALVIEAPPPTHHLIQRSVTVQGWGLAASRGYVEIHGLPRTPAELSHHSCLRFAGPRPQHTWTLTGPRDRKAVVKVQGAFECDDSRVLGEAIYAGIGIGVRPESEIAQGVRAGDLVHVLPGWRFGVRLAYILTTSARHGLPRVKAITEVVAAALRGLV